MGNQDYIYLELTVMAMLTRSEILEANDLARELVEVPEWGGSVYVRGLSGLERDQFEQSIITMKGKSARLKLENARARLVALGTIDADGKRLFSLNDVESLGQKSGVALERVSDIIRRLSGLTSDDVAELTANFTTGPSDVSTSA